MGRLKVELSVVLATALIKKHGGISAAARATKYSSGQLSRALATKCEKASPPKTATQVNTESAKVLSETESLRATVVQLQASIARLTAEKAHAIKPKAAPSTPVETAKIIRIPAIPAEPKKKTYMDVLGTADEYQGHIYGTEQKRSPLILLPASSELVKVLAIGDSHFHPAIIDKTLRAMTLVGLHAAAMKPRYIVHIGDHTDLHSLCHHERNDTWRARQKPSIRQDLDNNRVNWAALNLPMDEAGLTCPRHITLGNHEEWAWTFENNNPEVKGMISGEITNNLTSSGWTVSPYKQVGFVGGVGFVHHPTSIMGRAFGGQMPENTVVNQTTYDTVWGHTHRHASARKPRADGTRVTSLNVGSSMPEFYVGDFVQNSQGEKLDYGACEITIFDGRIQSWYFVTMREMEERHGRMADRYLSNSKISRAA